MKYTIRYQYATYSGERVVYANDPDVAIAKMWRELLQGGGIGMAYQSARIVREEPSNDTNEDKYE